MNKPALAFKRLFSATKRRQLARIKKAGVHQCVAMACGSACRVTGRNDRILKRPVVVMRFYECEICGRTMQSQTNKDARMLLVAEKQR